MRVIVTRPVHQAEAWCADLRRHGLQAEALPLIAIEALDDAASLRAAWQRLPAVELTVFVSANAVRQFVAAQSALSARSMPASDPVPEGARWPAGCRAAATGPGTAATLLDAGVDPALLTQPASDAEQFDSETLWSLLQHEDWTGRQVLIVRGEEGRNWLSEQFVARGAQVDFVVAYRRTVPQITAEGRSLLQAAQVQPAAHLWLFSSSEALANLQQIEPAADWQDSAALCTHPRIAQAARGAGFGQVAEVAPTLPAVVAWVLADPARRAAGESSAETAEGYLEIPSAEPPALTNGMNAAQAASSATAAPPAAASTPTPASTEARAAAENPVDTISAAVKTPSLPPADPVLDAPQTPAVAAASRATARWWFGAALVLALVLALTAGVLAWTTQKRLKSLESELVKRQRDSGSEAAEARVLARQAETASREASARVALIDARVAESTLQRGQLDEMMQSLARTRDENVLADLDAALRVAQQQAAITNSAEPLVLMLKQASEQLARQDQPRLDRVRQAVLQDLERVRNASGADIGTLALRIDEVVRQIDDLPLLAMPDRVSDRAAAERAVNATPAGEQSGTPDRSETETGATEEGLFSRWASRLNVHWQHASGVVWREVKSLVRVTPITQPDAVLLTPEQGLFLRENLKLRLLNARLALLSRQYALTQSDLLQTRSDLQRYFDRSARRVQAASDTLREVAAQSRQIQVPSPEATIAALSAAAAPVAR